MTTTTKQSGSQAVENGWAHYEDWAMAYELATSEHLTPLELSTLCDRLGIESVDNADELTDLACDYIRDSALSVEVKSGWQSYGQELVQQEWRVCFTTGGPSLYLQGELGQHDEPVQPRVFCGCWGEWAPLIVDRKGQFLDSDVLQWVADCFCFES